jgi:hypothetical protein
MLNEMYGMADELGGALSTPPLLPHYEVVRKLLGWKTARFLQEFIAGVKGGLSRSIDRIVYSRLNDSRVYD